MKGWRFWLATIGIAGVLPAAFNVAVGLELARARPSAIGVWIVAAVAMFAVGFVCALLRIVLVPRSDRDLEFRQRFVRPLHSVGPEPRS